MTRREARVRLTAEDAARVNDLADRFGVSGAALTIWALVAETDGLPVDDALRMAELAHRARAMPGYDPTPRADPGVYDRDGREVRPPRRYRVVNVPYDPDHGGEMIFPPVPGLDDWTVVRWAAAPAVPVTPSVVADDPR